MSIRRRCAAALAVVVGVVLPGCGWTSRDQFLSDRGVSIAPTPGDGSERYSKTPEDPFRASTAVYFAESPNR